MSKVAYDKNNEDVKGKLVIPYVWGNSERIQRIAKKCGLRTASHCRKTLGKFCIIPVSYTHLDVYKRQTYAFTCPQINSVGLK